MNPVNLSRILLLCVLLSVSACNDGGNGSARQTPASTPPVTTASNDTTQPPPQPQVARLTQIAVIDYIVEGSRRVGRTVIEYTLRAVARNTSASDYEAVTATLISVPPNITVLDGFVAFGNVAAGSSATSQDTLVVRVDLTTPVSLRDMVWEVSGQLAGFGGSGGQGQVGIFMNIDGLAIKGDAAAVAYEKWIELQSFAEGISQSTSLATIQPQPVLEGVTITKLNDSSSVDLRKALVSERIFTDIKIDIVKSCDSAIYTEYAITLSLASIKSLEMSAGANVESPTETLVIDYSRIESMYTPVDKNCVLGVPVYSYANRASP